MTFFSFYFVVIFVVYLKPPCKIADGYRQCGSSLMCKHTNEWCDGKADCPDGEDEDRAVCGMFVCKHFLCVFL